MLLCTFEPTGQFSGKQDVGQLALAVRQPAVVAPLAVKVVEADPAKVVGQRGDHHDPGGRAALQEPDEEVRQQEVSWGGGESGTTGQSDVQLRS